MQSEALRNIRTMRQVRTSPDVARNRKLRTTNSLSKTKEEVVSLESLADGCRLAQVLRNERQRSKAHEAAVNKSQQRLLRARGKLAATINKNRALTELRHDLQRARYEGDDPPPLQQAEPSVLQQRLWQMEVKY